MKNRTLALLVGIPAALIVILIAIAITFPFALPTIDTLVQSHRATTSVAPSAGSSGMAFYGGAPEIANISSDKSILMPIPPQTGGQTAAEVDQKIIKTGSLDLVVDHVSETAAQIGVLATGKGGYVQDSSVSEREDGTHYGSVTVRVPEKEFENMSTEAKKLATLVRSENATGQDVTESYTDLQARLKNAQSEEAAFLDTLKSAHTVQDILAVQQELFNVRAQIESLQGQIKYLENATSYSTLAISLSEEPAVNIPTKEFRPLTSAKEAVQALFAVFQNLAVVLIWAVIIGGGLLIPIALIVWAILAILRRRNRSSKR